MCTHYTLKETPLLWDAMIFRIFFFFFEKPVKYQLSAQFDSVCLSLGSPCTYLFGYFYPLKRKSLLCGHNFWRNLDVVGYERSRKKKKFMKVINSDYIVCQSKLFNTKNCGIFFFFLEFGLSLILFKIDISFCFKYIMLSSSVF